VQAKLGVLVAVFQQRPRVLVPRSVPRFWVSLSACEQLVVNVTTKLAAVNHDI
tara:strand:+ start:1804 stop:1962 length:159 start_codon:yes stop_codon:yes gene_type:complete